MLSFSDQSLIAIENKAYLKLKSDDTVFLTISILTSVLYSKISCTVLERINSIGAEWMKGERCIVF